MLRPSVRKRGLDETEELERSSGLFEGFFNICLINRHLCSSRRPFIIFVFVLDIALSAVSNGKLRISVNKHRIPRFVCLSKNKIFPFGM